MPRLPTMRVMGSHAMSTRFLDPGCPSADACWGIVDVMVAASLTCRVSPRTGCAGAARRGGWCGLPGAGRAGGELRAGCAPVRLLVQGALGDLAQVADGGAV